MTPQTADTLWSSMVLTRDNRQCQHCGVQAVAAHHVEGRRKHSLRWRVENGLSLCLDCHTGGSDFSAHLTPMAFDLWFQKTYPSRAALLQSLKHVVMKEREALGEFQLFLQDYEDHL